MRKGRVFWFGAHKVLKQTELKQLRSLGFEVFNPAYISSVYDQSMDRRIDLDQPTSLPPEIFAELLSHNFFYTQVPPRVAEMLNAYFDVVIVTINSDWLVSIMRAYGGQVVWRIYGQPHSLSEHLISTGMWERMVNREGFSIVPFAAESIEREHRWFTDLCAEIVPYQIADDVFAYSRTWEEQQHRQEIATSIPNIENPYYAHAYSEFNAQYPHRVMRIFGPQRSIPNDSRIVGALDRSELLRRFASASGYLYNYKDDVCYLPPIETMEIGGPVLYAPGSLLSRFYGGPSPGMVEDTQDAEKKMAWLLRGDKAFATEVIAAQDTVRNRYDRATVIPLFAASFGRLLGSSPTKTSSLCYSYPLLARRNVSPETPGGPVPETPALFYIFLHIDGLFEHRHGQAYAFEGIPRVVDIVVDTLIRFSQLNVVVTCTEQSLPVMHSFFHDHLTSGRLTLHAVRCSGSDGPRGNVDKLWMIEDVNRSAGVACVLIPHYYLFPEALALTAATILYLPDYFPYIMPNVVFDTSREKDAENKEVGVAVAAQSAAVITNSVFTREYLADAGFVSKNGLDKVVVAPLPLLGSRRAALLSDVDALALLRRIAGRRFLFYPTANRPNKQFAFLLRLFALLRLSYPDLALVLTGDLASVPKALEVADSFDLHQHLILLHRIDEGTLQWLYKNAAALCLTSTVEGNFPPQVLEALSYGTPIVATRLATMTEILGGQGENLLLCEALDIEDFSAKLERTLSHRADVLRIQAEVVAYLRDRNSPAKFYEGLNVAVLRCLPQPAER